jgi:hypothetical protein
MDAVTDLEEKENEERIKDWYCSDSCTSKSQIFTDLKDSP